MSLETIIRRSYQYNVKGYDYINGRLSVSAPDLLTQIFARDVEFETFNHWFVHRPSYYHEHFYASTVDMDKAIPTQITGAIGESVAVVLFTNLMLARNIQKIRERPSSKTADFSMDIQNGNRQEHILVESKGSNSVYSGPPSVPLSNAVQQLDETEAHHHRHVDRRFVVITCFPTHLIFQVEVK